MLCVEVTSGLVKRIYFVVATREEYLLNVLQEENTHKHIYIECKKWKKAQSVEIFIWQN